MRYTLLEMTQTILSAMDGDEVNSITDTVEATQVAHAIRQTYYDIVSRMDLPENYSFFELEASGTSTKPTLMTLPTDVNSVQWIKYNKIADGDTAPRFEDVTFLELGEFMQRMYLLNTDDDNVASFDHTLNGDSITFFYRDDKAPDFYTTFDDYTFIFDSYDVEVDSTLQKTKSQGYGEIIPTFDLDDATTPDLDANMFSMLINEAKSMCFADLKQSQNATAERRARRALISSQKKKRNIDSMRPAMYDLPNYGRRR